MKDKSKKHILFIFGGRGCERDISVRSADFVYPLLDRSRYTVTPVYIQKNGAWLMPRPTVKDGSASCEAHPENTEFFSCFREKNNEKVPKNSYTGIKITLSEHIEALVRGECEGAECAPAFIGGCCGIIFDGGFIPVDCAVPLLHGDFGEDGVVQGALENAKIPYIGCKVGAGAIICDKGITKLIAERLNIPTAPWIYSVASEGAPLAKTRAEAALGYPMFIKPATLGSSVGAAKVLSERDFISAYEGAASVCDRILIEKCISIKKELECAYFATKSKEIFTKIGEISYTGGFYDYDSKYAVSSEAVVSDSSDIPSALCERIHLYAKELCLTLGVRQISRIDFFLTVDGELIFNEINTMPGFTGGSLYPRLLSECGLATGEALSLLIEDATECTEGSAECTENTTECATDESECTEGSAE